MRDRMKENAGNLKENGNCQEKTKEVYRKCWTLKGQLKVMCRRMREHVRKRMRKT